MPKSLNVHYQAPQGRGFTHPSISAKSKSRNGVIAGKDIVRIRFAPYGHHQKTSETYAPPTNVGFNDSNRFFVTQIGVPISIVLAK